MKPLTDDEQRQLGPALLHLRIVVFALCFGVSIFAGFSIYQKIPLQPAAPQPWQELLKPPPAIKPLHIGALLFAGAAAALAFTVPPFLGGPKPKSSADRDSAIRQAAEIVHRRTVIACALLDGAAFLNIFCYFTDANSYNLAMSAILLLLLLLQFPMRGSYMNKIERIMGIDPFESQYASVNGDL